MARKHDQERKQQTQPGEEHSRDPGDQGRSPDVPEVQGVAGGPGLQTGRSRTNRIRPYDEDAEVNFEGGRGTRGAVFDEEEMGDELAASEAQAAERERQNRADKDKVQIDRSRPSKGGTRQEDRGQEPDWPKQGARISR